MMMMMMMMMMISRAWPAFLRILGTPEAKKLWKTTSGQIQDGGRRPNRHI